MKRIERWLLSLLFIHGVLLILTQLLIQQTDVHVYLNPIYEYLGVFEEGDDNILKTLDHVLDNVLSF
ncbi:DUF5359 family protein [Radiobacillus sp. PE A8.2]|uniref:DUF5359 family protein n=1 Tax=Radiobacillus sp. PE A8.2 TaxID=3380349 RepID=UPI00388F1074